MANSKQSEVDSYLKLGEKLFAELLKENATLTAKNEQLMADVDLQKAQNQKLEADLIEKGTIIENLKFRYEMSKKKDNSTIAELRRELASTKSSIGKLTRSNVKLENEKTALEESLHAKDKWILNHKQQIVNLVEKSFEEIHLDLIGDAENQQSPRPKRECVSDEENDSKQAETNAKKPATQSQDVNTEGDKQLIPKKRGRGRPRKNPIL